MKNKFKIEKGIDIPYATNGRGRKLKYPWNEMEVGDSFLVHLDKYDETKLNTLYAAANGYSLRNKDGKWKFTTRREGENVRIWRIT